MGFILAILISAVCLGAAYLYQLRRIREASFNKAGCKPPIEHTCLDPFYGMDFTLPTIRDISINLKYFKKLGRTFAVVPLLRNGRFHTVATENFQTIHGDPKVWGVQPVRLPAMGEIYGRSFITMDGEVQSLSKKLLRLTFSKYSSQHFSAFAKEVQSFVETVPGDGDTIDVQPLTFQIFFRSSLNFLLGIDLVKGAVGAPYSLEEFERSWNEVMFGLGLRLAFPLLASLLPKKKYLEAKKIFHGFLDYYVEKALRNTRDQKPSGSETVEIRNNRDQVSEVVTASLVRDLATQTDDPIFLRALVAQSLLAANATTSWLVSNALFCLARNPAVWKELRKEALAVAPAKLNRSDGLLDSTIYRRVFQETLRLYPIFPNLARVALEDSHLPSGGGSSGTEPVFVTKGDVVIGNTYVLHRDPAIFGEDAQAFNPSRWETIQPSKFEYLPFGSGARACLGEQKALMEATYIVAQIAARFESIESRDDREWKAELRGSCKNGNGCKIGLFVSSEV